jgi:hypothetical protein
MNIHDKFVLGMDMSIAQDGRAFSMTFLTRDGQETTVFSNIDAMQQLVSHLLLVTQDAANTMSDEDRANLLPPPGANVTSYPVDAVDVNVAHGRSPEEFMLDVQLGTVRLTFALPRDKADDLKGKLGAL